MGDWSKLQKTGRVKKECKTITLERQTAINWSQCCNDHGHGQMLKRRRRRRKIDIPTTIKIAYEIEVGNKYTHTSVPSVHFFWLLSVFIHFWNGHFNKPATQKRSWIGQRIRYVSIKCAWFGRNLLLIMCLYTFSWANKCANRLFND